MRVEATISGLSKLYLMYMEGKIRKQIIQDVMSAIEAFLTKIGFPSRLQPEMKHI